MEKWSTSQWIGIHSVTPPLLENFPRLVYSLENCESVQFHRGSWMRKDTSHVSALSSNLVIDNTFSSARKRNLRKPQYINTIFSVLYYQKAYFAKGLPILVVDFRSWMNNEGLNKRLTREDWKQGVNFGTIVGSLMMLKYDADDVWNRMTMIKLLIWQRWSLSSLNLGS